MNETIDANLNENVIRKVEAPGETFQAPETKEKALLMPTGYAGYTNKDVDVLRKTAFSECKTLEDLAMACQLAKGYKLDPFAKEIWAMNMKGKLVIEASASGWRKIIRRQPGFKRMVLQAWYENDEIGFDLVNSKVTKHIQNPAERSKSGVQAIPDPNGAYCFVEYENGLTNLSVVYWEEYQNSGTNNGSPWKKQKSEMIKNKAAAVFGRTYCGVSGLYSEGETENISSSDPSSRKQEMRELKTKSSSIVMP